ncbi:FUSC family protein [Duganella sp. FT134W]|uniref:FUSC family protein n=1 Tax=Duganella margarita TaxID=2692170 RepID=A0A7X4H1E0_9BURK|nr:FUSC family protein [Duganella margarita]MYM73528.1 FUSC family protein [Duganella margarita]
MQPHHPHCHQSDTGPRALLAELWRDFTPWPAVSLRLADEIICLVSVLLAIFWSHLLGVGNVGWAAFSAYMVIRTSFADSLWRGGLRVLGTAAGVALAWLLAPHLMRATALLSIALALGGAITLYRALLDRRGYGWLIAGLSFAMVLVDGMQRPDQPLGQFAQARLLEVCVGTGAALLVSALAVLALPRSMLPQAPPASAPAAPACRRAAWRHALQGGIALALIPWLWRVFPLQALSQSSITIMAVMMVPMADLAALAQPAATRLRHRLVGASLGGLLATAVLLLSHASPLVMMLAAGIGVVIGRHIENGKLPITYAGTQFALAFLVVLVPDGGPDAALGIERLAGVFLGMALLEPVRLLFQRFAR